MNPAIEILGVHPIRSAEPCHLVEVRITGNEEKFDVGKFIQEWPGKEKASWQVAYDEKFLEADGTECKLGWMLNRDDPQFWRRDIRLVFFFHYLDFDRSLGTPFGPIAVPAPSKRPARLAFMKYSPP